MTTRVGAGAIAPAPLLSVAIRGITAVSRRSSVPITWTMAQWREICRCLHAAHPLDERVSAPAAACAIGQGYLPELCDGPPDPVWRDLERLSERVGELSKSVPTVVFCACGFHVACKTAVALRDAGFDPKYMKGGHSASKVIGGP